MYELVKGSCADCDLKSECVDCGLHFVGTKFAERMIKAGKKIKHYNCETKKAIQINASNLAKTVQECGSGYKIKLTYNKKRRF